MFDQYPVCV